MTLWKQRLLSRLQGPATDDGSDTGGAGSATASAIDAIGADNDGDTDQANASQDDGHVEQGDNQGDNQGNGEGVKHDPQAKLRTMLDALSDEPGKKPEPAAPKADTKPAGSDEGKPQGEAKPQGEKNPDQEEAELLEGVKSDRGRDRIKQVFTENKDLKNEIREFQELVKSTGMSADQFANTLEFGRLMSSGTPENLRIAAQMLDTQRAQIYAALGEEAPGVDLLAGHQDLKDQVENMDITRERAIELAKFRKQDADKKARETSERQSTQRQADFQKTVSDAATQMDAYLQTRAKEMDHPARLEAIGQKFKDPAFMQEFVTTYKPNQWVPVIRMMYDGVQVSQQPVPRQQASQQPIRARSASLGNPAPNGGTPLDRVAQRLENMGI